MCVCRDLPGGVSSPPTPHSAPRLPTDLGLVLGLGHLLNSSHCPFHQGLKGLIGQFPLKLPTALDCHKRVYTLTGPSTAPCLGKEIKEGPEWGWGPTLDPSGAGGSGGWAPGPWRSRWSGAHSAPPHCTGGCPAPPLPHLWPPGGSGCQP